MYSGGRLNLVGDATHANICVGGKIFSCEKKIFTRTGKIIFVSTADEVCEVFAFKAGARIVNPPFNKFPSRVWTVEGAGYNLDLQASYLWLSFMGDGRNCRIWVPGVFDLAKAGFRLVDD